METVNATLSLYANAAVHAARGFPKTLLALLVLFAGTAALIGVELLFFEPMGDGFISRIGRALLQDVFLGTYLSLIGLWVLAGRSILPRHIRLHAGNLFIPLLTVVFYFWIARMLLGFTGIPRAGLLLVVAALVVNPIPEVLYQDRQDGTYALQQAFTFLSKNWPEWLVAQIPWVVALTVWQVVFGGGPDVDVIARLWIETGASMEALHIPSILMWPLDPSNALGFAGGALLLVMVHYFFLFRGYLYRELSKGNRRLRAWQSRM